MRVYLPSTLPALAELLRTGELGPAPVRGFAVTPALREWYSSGDVEELEYVALMHAAKSSLRMLAEQPLAPQRRVVLAAELTAGLAGGQEIGPEDPALVRISAPGAVDRHRVRARRRPGRGKRDRGRGGGAGGGRRGR